MMDEGGNLALAALAGAALGALFFGGLWWTVRALPTTRHAGSLMLGSLLLRVAGALTGFHLAADGQWRRLLACLLGFLLARALVLRVTGRASAREARRDAP